MAARALCSAAFGTRRNLGRFPGGTLIRASLLDCADTARCLPTAQLGPADFSEQARLRRQLLPERGGDVTRRLPGLGPAAGGGIGTGAGAVDRGGGCLPRLGPASRRPAFNQAVLMQLLNAAPSTHAGASLRPCNGTGTCWSTGTRHTMPVPADASDGSGVFSGETRHHASQPLTRQHCMRPPVTAALSTHGGT